MRSEAPLAYAEFLLSPRRSRCELFIAAEVASRERDHREEEEEAEKINEWEETKSKKKKMEREKVASGLVRPFVAHLRAAELQFMRGAGAPGGVIRLYPHHLNNNNGNGSNGHGSRRRSVDNQSSSSDEEEEEEEVYVDHDIDDARLHHTNHPSSKNNWFSKATLERFVRFVSTPEIMERVKAIEDELLQLQQVSNALANSSSSAMIKPMSMDHQLHHAQPTGDDGLIDASDRPIENNNTGSHTRTRGHHETQPDREDSSKSELLRAMEARMNALRQEQRMAFARANAAGFDVEHMTDLIIFAEKFGADRLRDACLHFVALARKHCSDWASDPASSPIPKRRLDFGANNGKIRQMGSADHTRFAEGASTDQDQGTVTRTRSDSDAATLQKSHSSLGSAASDRSTASGNGGSFFHRLRQMSQKVEAKTTTEDFGLEQEFEESHQNQLNDLTTITAAEESETAGLITRAQPSTNPNDQDGATSDGSNRVIARPENIVLSATSIGRSSSMPIMSIHLDSTKASADNHVDSHNSTVAASMKSGPNSNLAAKSDGVQKKLNYDHESSAAAAGGDRDQSQQQQQDKNVNEAPVRRLSVAAAISLFESKKQDSPDPPNSSVLSRKHSSRKISTSMVESESPAELKTVLRRWNSNNNNSTSSSSSNSSSAAAAEISTTTSATTTTTTADHDDTNSSNNNGPRQSQYCYKLEDDKISTSSTSNWTSPMPTVADKATVADSNPVNSSMSHQETLPSEIGRTSTTAAEREQCTTDAASILKKRPAAAAAEHLNGSCRASDLLLSANAAEGAAPADAEWKSRLAAASSADEGRNGGLQHTAVLTTQRHWRSSSATDHERRPMAMAASTRSDSAEVTIGADSPPSEKMIHHVSSANEINISAALSEIDEAISANTTSTTILTVPNSRWMQQRTAVSDDRTGVLRRVDPHQMHVDKKVPARRPPTAAAADVNSCRSTTTNKSAGSSQVEVQENSAEDSLHLQWNHPQLKKSMASHNSSGRSAATISGTTDSFVNMNSDENQIFDVESKKVQQQNNQYWSSPQSTTKRILSSSNYNYPAATGIRESTSTITMSNYSSARGHGCSSSSMTTDRVVEVMQAGLMKMVEKPAAPAAMLSSNSSFIINGDNTAVDVVDINHVLPGKLYDHYAKLRDAKLKQESPARRAEREAKLRSMQEVLEKKKAEMASKRSSSSSSLKQKSNFSRKHHILQQLLAMEPTSSNLQQPITSIKELIAKQDGYGDDDQSAAAEQLQPADMPEDIFDIPHEQEGTVPVSSPLQSPKNNRTSTTRSISRPTPAVLNSKTSTTIPPSGRNSNTNNMNHSIRSLAFSPRFVGAKSSSQQQNSSEASGKNSKESTRNASNPPLAPRDRSAAAGRKSNRAAMVGAGRNPVDDLSYTNSSEDREYIAQEDGKVPQQQQQTALVSPNSKNVYKIGGASPNINSNSVSGSKILPAPQETAVIASSPNNPSQQQEPASAYGVTLENGNPKQNAAGESRPFLRKGRGIGPGAGAGIVKLQLQQNPRISSAAAAATSSPVAMTKIPESSAGDSPPADISDKFSIIDTDPSSSSSPNKHVVDDRIDDDVEDNIDSAPIAVLMSRDSFSRPASVSSTPIEITSDGSMADEIISRQRWNVVGILSTEEDEMIRSANSAMSGPNTSGGPSIIEEIDKSGADGLKQVGGRRKQMLLGDLLALQQQQQKRSEEAVGQRRNSSINVATSISFRETSSTSLPYVDDDGPINVAAAAATTLLNSISSATPTANYYSLAYNHNDAIVHQLRGAMSGRFTATNSLDSILHHGQQMNQNNNNNNGMDADIMIMTAAAAAAKTSSSSSSSSSSSLQLSSPVSAAAPKESYPSSSSNNNKGFKRLLYFGRKSSRTSATAPEAMISSARHVQEAAIYGSAASEGDDHEDAVSSGAEMQEPILATDGGSGGEGYYGEYSEGGGLLQRKLWTSSSTRGVQLQGVGQQISNNSNNNSRKDIFLFKQQQQQNMYGGGGPDDYVGGALVSEHPEAAVGGVPPLLHQHNHHLQLFGGSSNIPPPPPNFKLREDPLHPKGPRSFFSLSPFRSKGNEGKSR